MLNQIGNLNPQLLRELKGRLSWRNVLAVIGVSIAVQGLLFLSFYTQLPTPESYQYSQFCAQIVDGKIIPRCYSYGKLIPFKSVVINWSLWWQHIGHVLNTCIPYLLMVPGTYFLLSDLQNEERQGTLDFVRLSPRSASSILIGKILGVPILVYCAIASLIPLHLWVTLNTGDPLSFVFSFYTMMAAGSYLIFSFTLLFGFFSKSILKLSAQALGVTLLYVLLVACIFVPAYQVWNTEIVWRTLLDSSIWNYFRGQADAVWFWFGLPISQSAAIAHSFTLVNLAILGGWIWQGLTRRFDQPNATILRKRQSYGLVFYLQVLILGIGFQAAKDRADSEMLQHIGVVLLPIVLNLPIFLTLIAVLSPHRQAVMDWARYRQTQSPRSSLLKDLLFHDHSPVGLSIAVNLAISGVLWAIAFSFGHEWAKGREGTTMIMVSLSLTVILFYASIVQWLVIQKTRQRNFIAAVVIVMLILIPPAFVSLLPLKGSITTALKESVILTSPFLWTLTGSSFSISLSAWSALLGQLSLIAGINALIARQVRQIGASELKNQQFAKLKPNS